jgi:hypothetical protein
VTRYLALLTFAGAAAAYAQEDGLAAKSGVTPLTVMVAASPDAGFFYPYFLKLSTVSRAPRPTRLIVETNNTGTPSDDFEDHLRAARRATEQSVGAFAANRLELPLLVPAFPRPASDSLVYTHALDSDSLDIETGPMRRLDLQLLAMVDDAIKRLKAAGIAAEPQFLMTGFSASATFANRFTMIHPERVARLAIGGFNGVLMLPTARVNGTDLPYPLGLSDYEARFGAPFDREAWLAIPQFLFMGENDTNDAVKFDDAYPETDRRIVYGVMGESMQPDRWRFVQRVYRDSGANIVALTYREIGHGTNERINEDVAEFLAGATEILISDRVALGMGLGAEGACDGGNTPCVSSVRPNGAADRAGIRRGDVVRRFGTREIGTPADLADAVAEAKNGDRVVLVVHRRQRELTLEIEFTHEDLLAY